EALRQKVPGAGGQPAPDRRGRGPAMAVCDAGLWLSAEGSDSDWSGPEDQVALLPWARLAVTADGRATASRCRAGAGPLALASVLLATASLVAWRWPLGAAQHGMARIRRSAPGGQDSVGLSALQSAVTGGVAAGFTSNAARRGRAPVHAAPLTLGRDLLLTATSSPSETAGLCLPLIDPQLPAVLGAAKVTVLCQFRNVWLGLRAGSNGTVKGAGGGGQQQQQQQALDSEQAKVWLEMSADQFEAAAAVLSQSARDKLKHMRWKREIGFEGLVSVKEAKDVQQAIDSKATELQRARSSFDKAKVAIQKATGQCASSRALVGKLEQELKQMVEEAKAKAARCPPATAAAAESAVSAASHVAKVLSSHPGWQQQVGAALAGPLTVLLQALTAHRDGVGGAVLAGAAAAATAAAAGGGGAAEGATDTGGGTACIVDLSGDSLPVPEDVHHSSLSDVEWDNMVEGLSPDFPNSDADKKRLVQELREEAWALQILASAVKHRAAQLAERDMKQRIGEFRKWVTAQAGTGTSRTLIFLCHGKIDPLYRATLLPIVAFVRAIWES
ncbi:unnamed protein product, partial [Prorocentrum cordatum]